MHPWQHWQAGKHQPSSKAAEVTSLAAELGLMCITAHKADAGRQAPAVLEAFPPASSLARRTAAQRALLYLVAAAETAEAPRMATAHAASLCASCDVGG